MLHETAGGKVLLEGCKIKHPKSKMRRSTEEEEEEDGKAEDGKEEFQEQSIDMDMLSSTTFLERLYAIILHLHEDYDIKITLS